jgi:hypothetical protein
LQTVFINGGNFQPGMTLTFISPEGVVASNAAGNVSVSSLTTASCQFNSGGESGTWKVFATSPDGLYNSSTDSFRVRFVAPQFYPVSKSRTNVVYLTELQSNLTYIEEYSASLSDTNWILVQTISNKSQVTYFTNAIGADPGRYFRLRLSQ